MDSLEDALRFLQHQGRRYRELTYQIDDSIALLDRALTADYREEILVPIVEGPSMTELSPFAYSDTINAFGLRSFVCDGRKQLAMAVRVEHWTKMQLLQEDGTMHEEDVIGWTWYPLVNLPGQTVPEIIAERARVWFANNAADLITQLCDCAVVLTSEAEKAAARVADIAAILDAPPAGERRSSSDNLVTYTHKRWLDAMQKHREEHLAR